MEHALDIVVIILLVLAMAYGFALNRRITLIQNSKKDLAKLFKTFDATILKAQTSIEELKEISKESSTGLQKAIDKALLLYDDLSYLNERSEKITEKMEKIVKASRINQVKSLDTEKKEASEVKQNLVVEKSSEEIEQFKTEEKLIKKQQALEKLMVKVAESREGDKKTKLKKDDKVVVDALKVLGYGETTK